MAVDLKGMFVCARAAFTVMKEQASGKIINIASGTAVSGFPNMLPYVSAKAGAIGFTRALATELGPYNINVNAIIVGFVPHSFAGIPDEIIERIKERSVATQTFKRPGEAEDISRVVVFLASEDSRWITGQAIAVDGGNIRTGG
ncbi:MAG TPA: SDR family oxidoreductase [Dehalococcoidia bacterium]|nr:SDR family oxidoreductase [Dehalococcoidia bacterium]